MWPVSQQWLASLGTSHRRYTRMEAWYGGSFVATIPVESGSVQVTARNRVRRTLAAVVAEANWPFRATDPLAPYGAQLKVWQGITGVDGGLIGSEVPIFAGRVEEVGPRQRKAGKFQLAALDPFAAINDDEFEAPVAPTPGAAITDVIKALITEVYPTAVFRDETTGGQLAPAGMLWDTDRGQAIDDLAAALGAEVFCRPDGVTWVIRPIPTLLGTPVWTLRDGQGGTLVRDAMKKARTDVANRIIVHVERNGQTPLLTVVTDDSPTSPTRYGGPYGKVVRNIRNPLITTPDQAYTAGLARLSRYIGLSRTRDVDTIPNPALEAGDLIQIVTDEGTEWHIADAFAVPLAVTDAMTVTTRSTQTSTSQ